MNRVAFHISPMLFSRLLACLLSLLFFSCQKKQTLDKRITIYKEGTMPYGVKVAYDNLKWIFPDADISLNEKSPVSLHNQGSGMAYIIVTPTMDPDGEELNALLNLAGSGSHVFISSFYFGDTLLNTLKIRSVLSPYPYDSMRVSIYQPVSKDSLSFAYPGYGMENYVTELDTAYTEVLGRDANGRANFLKIGYRGGGSMILHFNPLAFTNFFLLHKDNINYYNDAFSYLPASVNHIVWDQYFRHIRRGRNNFSALSYIFGRSPETQPLKWGFTILLLLFLTIYLFESKRRQRIVPDIPAVRNNSLDFVKTIGRLYYQRRDNRDLASKMATHFQGHIRSRYNVTGALSEEGLAERLSYKTGLPLAFLNELIGEALRLRESPVVEDEEVLALDGLLKEFYKQA